MGVVAARSSNRRSELLERSRQFAALGESLGAVLGRSHGRLVLVGGEAGVGKTALVSRFCEEREGVHALILASYRDEELDRAHPLRLVLGEFASARTVERLKIEPLSQAAVATLAEPQGVDAEELYRKTAGIRSSSRRFWRRARMRSRTPSETLCSPTPRA
jgi:hypothetical protein